MHDRDSRADLAPRSMTPADSTGAQAAAGEDARASTQRLDAQVRTRRAGMIYGFIGVAAFSITLPATRAAVASLDPVFVGLGRAVVAGVLAAITLALTRSPFPGRSQLPRLALVALGVIVGFPLFSAWAMRYVPAAHGAVVIGLLPLATALAGAWLAHERPSRRFWASAVFGSAVVVGFALWQGGGAPHPADALLLIAVALAAIGYAEGGPLARSIGGWQVICWALVLAAPLLAIPTWLSIDERVATAPPAAWLGFAYVAVVSMFLGFFAWYRGLAMGGIAAVGQVQLLQPFLTIFASALLLAERIDVATIVAAALVIASIAVGRRS
jgi:drug/metabolite transporter (DMT)-like permease